VARGLLLAVVATGLGCRGRQPPPPPELEVEYAGCGSVVAGPVCLLDGDRTVTLWTRTDPGATLQLEVDGRGVDGRGVDGREVDGGRTGEDGVEDGVEVGNGEVGGRRHRVEIPAGARVLTVRARGGDGAEARWRLALRDGDAGPAWRAEVTALLRAGELERARRRAEAALVAAPASGLALGALARIELHAGEVAASRRLFERALRAHADAGRLSDQTRDGAALFYLLAYRRHDLSAARRVLEAMPRGWGGPAESAYDRAYYRGLLAALTGDLRTALRSLEAAAERARRLDLPHLRLAAEQVLVRQLQQLGRREEEEALRRRLLEAAEGDRLPPCQRGQLLNNVGWSALLDLEAGPGDDPTPILERALDTFVDGCPQLVHERVNVRINLGLAHLHAGRTAAARRQLEAADRLGPIPELRLMLWRLELEGRLALAEGRPEEALQRYDRLARLAAVALSPDAGQRAALGRARALEAVGRVGAALDALADAERRLEEASRRAPLTEGREGYLARRQDGIRHHLELLLDAGRGAEAFAVARRSRTRILRGLLRRDRLERLPPAEQARWDRAVSAYRRDREELDRAAGGDWRLPAAELERLEAERAATHRRLLRQLDDALAMLDRRAPDPARLPPPRPGELLLLYHPLPSGWVGFAHDGRRLTAARLPCRDLDRAPAELTGCLLRPFADRVEEAERLRILPHGPLRHLDFHALPWDGGPLLATRPVLYGLDLPPRPERSRAEAPRALLVADPAGDLPAARREADAVARLLAAAPAGWRATRLDDTAAGAAEVRARLPDADLFHYAGHAAFAGPGGWRSALPLAAGGRLTVGDLLLLERAPRWVVLSGCETARTAGGSAAETVGLAHAFLAAGAGEVVAAVRPVADADGLRLFEAFYRAWTAGEEPAVALRRAQLELRRADPAADWAAFRILAP